MLRGLTPGPESNRHRMAGTNSQGEAESLKGFPVSDRGPALPCPGPVVRGPGSLGGPRVLLLSSQGSGPLAVRRLYVSAGVRGRCCSVVVTDKHPPGLPHTGTDSQAQPQAQTQVPSCDGRTTESVDPGLLMLGT